MTRSPSTPQRSWEFGIGNSESTVFIPHSACRIPHCEAGFTLVELIVVSALLLIVGGGLLTAVMTGQTSYLSADAYVQVQQETRRAFDSVVRELREAGNVTSTPLNTWPTNQLNFQIALGYNQVGCPNAICWGSEDATKPWVHYATLLPGSGNRAQLIRWLDTTPTPGVPGSCPPSTCRVLANHVKSASFKYTSGTKVITVSLQVEYKSPLLPSGSQATPSLTSQVKLRNP